MPLQPLQCVKEDILRYHRILVHIYQPIPPGYKSLLVNCILGIHEALSLFLVERFELEMPRGSLENLEVPSSKPSPENTLN